jgi:type IV fimbrial biogenesis protein FimT
MGNITGKRRKLFATLHESLLAAALVAIVTNLTVPSVSAMLQNSATSREAYALATALTAAREVAVTRSRPVMVCGLASREEAGRARCAQDAPQWRHGWMVYVPASNAEDFDDARDEVLHVNVYTRADLGIRTDLDTTALRFLPDGSALVDGESRFHIAVAGGEARTRDVVISGVGRARIADATPRT